MEEDERVYFIPANAKRSGLILGYFTMTDLLIFAPGIIASVIMLLTIQTSSLLELLLLIAPGLIAAFLVMPVPYYHNIMQLIVNIFTFFFGQRRYKWRGWCIWDEQ